MPQQDETTDISKLTVNQLKDALKESNVPYDKYRKKRYYLTLYENHIEKGLPVEQQQLSEASDSQKTPSKSTSISLKKTPRSSRKLKRKTSDRDEDDDTEEPPAKKARLDADEAEEKDSKPSIKIAPASHEVNQLRASKQDATPMPSRTSKAPKSFVPPPKINKPSAAASDAEKIGASSFVDPSLLNAPKNTTEEPSTTAEPKQNQEEPELIEEVEETTSQDYVTEEPEPKITPFIYLLRVLILGLIIAASYFAITSFSTGAGKPFQSVVQQRPFCTTGETGRECSPCPQFGLCNDGRLISCEGNRFVKNNICIRGLPNYVTNMAYDVERILEKAAKASPDACLHKAAHKTADELKAILEGKSAFVGKMEDFMIAIRDGLVQRLSIDKDNVISLTKSATMLCLSRRVFREVCAHKKSIFAVLTLLVCLMILVGSDDESESVSVLKSAILMRMRNGEESSVNVDDLKEHIKDAAIDVYSEQFFSKALNELKNDPRVSFEDNQISYRD
uniref:LEM domain-containing protein n=1 Tax=Percolomonas cosmopolitus TaxID=63605 RepID=A0A7S1KTG9_9EUKA|eukprot:CAMPEP_0117439854 /NCGR_PEP_ID=MMETSP0759-20121206/2776_1 /TAXON_ID=63605 /ORGANISM="Percolomonas cosmopolitus, Strain WS" /LENGTH=505 /DNA_ID=CAMNT_0005231575 /DNA_START=31 /DNA_END=1548 /DNA_ORIENTATION=-